MIRKTMTPFQRLLKKLSACKDAKKWAEEKSWQEVYDTCHRGDWLLWLYSKTNPDDLRGLTLATGLCVNTVRHLMKDEMSINAIDAAIKFGKGEIEREELDAAAVAARAVAHAPCVASAAAYYAAGAAFAADAYAATYAAGAAYATYAAADAAEAYAVDAAKRAADYDAAADAAEKINQKETADIVRSVLPIEKWNIKT